MPTYRKVLYSGVKLLSPILESALAAFHSSGTQQLESSGFPLCNETALLLLLKVSILRELPFLLRLTPAEKVKCCSLPYSNRLYK